MAMKELGKRMHCDPSFVTLVADMLEKRGLARREPHPADRRVKNIVLTDDGVALKHRVEAELTARMPWNQALTEDERAQLLALIRKMLSAGSEAADAGGVRQGRPARASGRPAVHAPAGEHRAGQRRFRQLRQPPGSDGEVNSAVSETSASS